MFYSHAAGVSSYLTFLMKATSKQRKLKKKWNIIWKALSFLLKDIQSGKIIEK